MSTPPIVKLKVNFTRANGIDRTERLSRPCLELFSRAFNFALPRASLTVNYDVAATTVSKKMGIGFRFSRCVPPPTTIRVATLA